MGIVPLVVALVCSSFLLEERLVNTAEDGGSVSIFSSATYSANSALFLAVSFRYASVSAFFSIATDLSACIPVFSVFDEVSAFKTIVAVFSDVWSDEVCSSALTCCVEKANSTVALA